VTGPDTRSGGGDFARSLIAWHRRHGRHDLPWQRNRDPYRVWLSEIMLQQTQVGAVLPYYARFLERFPTVFALADAPGEDVMACWAGLGYYARARNLHACARLVVREHQGEFPQHAAALAQLPGIGPSTAAAIAAFCFSERAAILDGNVKRVLARHWAIEGSPRTASVTRALWQRAQSELPVARSIAAYTQAIMDLGATVCTRTRPACERCPVRESCEARRQGRADDLPARRARSAKSHLTAHVLIAIRGDEVLLQERPPSGIWGGLVGLPQFDTLAALRRASRRIAPDAARAEPLAPHPHELTHISMILRPYRLQVSRRRKVISLEPSCQWVSTAAVSRIGMPVPHRRLLISYLRPLKSGS
jgi:A/G-specific adenine glycosylase